ncbi:DeoR family fructose operon transcriptional repressor [Streptomyces sp. V4I23]|uniref:DeoR/GlpR family DNA-binding transcription regulator n=1 Tax=Streptomyces sp. V4I23 TaxID=3042282 RepID=UPI0027878C34|nr:DeoR/GlpR family DNA-binding transcription regulator [Streptomyces sp. V4I23]MDQ1005913.1 DeoR family fructose operon transcriptional repressor [Streptomyces sp. V4I23]
MESEERRRQILDLARQAGSVDVVQLAEELGVAKETVRRDLRTLEQHGLVRRTHGGAHPVESAGFETTLALRTTMHVGEKLRIAKAAVELLGDAETVFIDEGYTPQLIADALPHDRQLTVITASLQTAASLAARDNISVLLLGGRVRGGTVATVGQWASGMLSGFVIDLAYLGANGISREYGLTTPDPLVSEVKSQATRISRRRIFSGVYTKFGAVSFCRFAEVGAFEAIITDTRLSQTEAHRYSLLGPRVIRV